MFLVWLQQCWRTHLTAPKCSAGLQSHHHATHFIRFALVAMAGDALLQPPPPSLLTSPPLDHAEPCAVMLLSL
eukprot:12158244-Alexandrium_andersonii.AAC.1